MIVKKKLFAGFMLMLFGVLCLTTNFISSAIVSAADSGLTPNSKASVLIECGSGQILAEKDSTKQLPIASVTKLMTILLTLENIENGNLTLDTKVVASENAAGMGGSQVFLDANSEYVVKNLLKAVIVASANDASVALAETIAGSEQAFVEMMNNKAKQLNLQNTNYVNCSGLPAPSQYSCAIDVANIMRELTQYPLYFELSKIWMEDFEHPSGRVTTMANTNKLIRYYQGCDAGKTGSTNEAGYCLAATANKNNMRLISVVLGADTSKNRFADASNQLNFGFANYESTKVVDSQKNMAEQVSLQKAKENNLILLAEEDYFVVNKKGEKPELETQINLPNKLNAPLKQGDVVGTITISKNGVVEKEINIIVQEDVEAQGYWQTTKSILEKWSF